MIRLLAFTSEPLNAVAMRLLCSDCNDITLVGTPAKAPAAIPCIILEHPDVVLFEVEAERDWTLLRELHASDPAIQIVLWTRDIEPEMAYYAIESGVRGILRKTLPTEMILKCIRKVSEGELWLETAMTDLILNGTTVRLSNREAHLVKLVSQGLKNKEIASVMGITEGTVKVYLSRLFEKVGVRDRLELSLFGLRSTNPGSSGFDAAQDPAFAAPGAAVAGQRKHIHKVQSRYFLRGIR